MTQSGLCVVQFPQGAVWECTAAGLPGKVTGLSQDGGGRKAGVGICRAEATELCVCWGWEGKRQPEHTPTSQLGELPVVRMGTGADQMA